MKTGRIFEQVSQSNTPAQIGSKRVIQVGDFRKHRRGQCMDHCVGDGHQSKLEHMQSRTIRLRAVERRNRSTPGLDWSTLAAVGTAKVASLQSLPLWPISIFVFPSGSYFKQGPRDHLPAWHGIRSRLFSPVVTMKRLNWEPRISELCPTECCFKSEWERIASIDAWDQTSCR